MARPTQAPWTLGKITYTPHRTKAGHFQARGYFTNDDGVRREVTASGKTQKEAKSALENKVQATRNEWRGSEGERLQPSTTTLKAAEVWLDWKRRERSNDKALSDSTIRDYEGYIRRCIEGSSIADVPLIKVNDVARIEAWLTAVADERGQTSAKQARKVLGGVLSLAERRKAIPESAMRRVEMPAPSKGSKGDRKCVDDECDYICGKRHLNTKRAFSAEEVAAVMAYAEASAADIADLCAFLFGTGCRISEALTCVAWADVDLEAKTVHVRGTKTEKSDRVLTLSDELADRLKARAEVHGTKGQVFGVTRYADKAGHPRDKNNVSKRLRETFRKAGVQWAGTHTFRRTVASWMDKAGHSLAEIADQLGHADTRVTAAYLGRKKIATGAASVMILPAPAPLRLVV